MRHMLGGQFKSQPHSQLSFGVKSICLAFFIHSQDAIKHLFSFVVETGG